MILNAVLEDSKVRIQGNLNASLVQHAKGQAEPGASWFTEQPFFEESGVWSNVEIGYIMYPILTREKPPFNEEQVRVTHRVTVSKDTRNVRRW